MAGPLARLLSSRGHYLALRAEAKQHAEARLAEVIGSEGYADLAERVGDDKVELIVGPDGHEWQVKIDVFLDDPGRGRNLRVVVIVDDGGWMAFMPPSADTIVTDPAESDPTS